MTLFTAEGLLRAHNRWLARGVRGGDDLLYRAYLEWLATQGERVPAGVSRDPGGPGWLASEMVLQARRAPGATCLSALRSGRMGTREAPLNDSKGCGAVMRVAPLGLGRDVDPFDLACRVGAITHGHVTGQVAGGFLAYLIAQLAGGSSLEEAVGGATDRLREERGCEETLRAVEQAVALARGRRGTVEQVERLGEGWVAEEALAIALYAALVAPSFEAGVLLAVNHSGDSDSTGSIAGQILGLLHGATSIPTPWLEELEGREVIERVAEDLWRHFGEGATQPAPGSSHGDEDRYPA